MLSNPRSDVRIATFLAMRIIDELIYKICKFRHASAAEFLMTVGVVDRLYKLLQDITEQPDAGFLFPGMLKSSALFGHVFPAV